jgi:hypothetical protein
MSKDKSRALFQEDQRRRLVAPLGEFSVTENSRERVITMGKLNLLASPGTEKLNEFMYMATEYPYKATTLNELIRDGDLASQGNFGESAESVAQYLEKFQDIHDLALAELEKANATHAYEFLPKEVAEYEIGVAAMEFTRDDITVLVFRGSYSSGDFTNAKNWIMPYVIQTMSEKLKFQWETVAGLEWDAVRQDRESKGDLVARTIISFAPANKVFGKTLSEKVGEDASLEEVAKVLDETEAFERGYWEITKFMANNFADAHVGDKANIMLSGYSQVSFTLSHILHLTKQS